MRDILQQRLACSRSAPIIAVHVRDIEPVAITPPDFVEYLVPLGRARDRYQARGQTGFRVWSHRRGVVAPKPGLVASEPSYRHWICITEDVLGDYCFLRSLKVNLQLRRAIAGTAVVERGPDTMRR
jgi:hypothetical protein